MLESWEKLIFSKSTLNRCTLAFTLRSTDTFVLAAFVLSIYTTINYLPENVNYFFSELFEYFPDMKAYMPSRLIQTVRDLYSRQEL